MALTQVNGGMLDSVAQQVGFRNRIINGAMMIDQRNAGAAVTATSTFPVDRFYITMSVASKFTAQQNAGSVTPPTGFTKYLGITSSSAYTVGASEIFSIQHRIEGFNAADLAWGTANASAVTLSFLVRSSLTGTFGGALYNSGSTRNYPFSYTISSANTWTNITITIPGDTTGTWLTNNGVGIGISWGLGVGSTYSGTAGSWGASQVFSTTGATSVVGTNGATFYITGVQLEKGSTATSFDYRPYGTELALCQRYYYRLTTNGANDFGVGVAASATACITGFALPVTPRVPFTGIETSTVTYFSLSLSSGYTITAITFYGQSSSQAGVIFTTSSMTTGNAIRVGSNNAGAYIGFTGAEL